MELSQLKVNKKSLYFEILAYIRCFAEDHQDEVKNWQLLADTQLILLLVLFNYKRELVH